MAEQSPAEEIKLFYHKNGGGTSCPEEKGQVLVNFPFSG
jgi:hypothetical protein